MTTPTNKTDCLGRDDDEHAIEERLAEATALYRDYLAITEVTDLARLLAYDRDSCGPPRTDLPLTLTIQSL